MATKPKGTAATVKQAGPAKVTRTPAARVASADALSVVVAERDALRQEVTSLRARVQTLVSVRAELETRLDSAVDAVHKLLGR
jgi:uncharacterized protein YlxW (UPF0749 family)